MLINKLIKKASFLRGLWVQLLIAGLELVGGRLSTLFSSWSGTVVARQIY